MGKKSEGAIQQVHQGWDLGVFHLCVPRSHKMAASPHPQPYVCRPNRKRGKGRRYMSVETLSLKKIFPGTCHTLTPNIDFCLYLLGQNWIMWLLLAARESGRVNIYLFESNSRGRQGKGGDLNGFWEANTQNYLETTFLNHSPAHVDFSATKCLFVEV